MTTVLQGFDVSRAKTNLETALVVLFNITFQKFGFCFVFFEIDISFK